MYVLGLLHGRWCLMHFEVGISEHVANPIRCHVYAISKNINFSSVYSNDEIYIKIREKIYFKYL